MRVRIKILIFTSLFFSFFKSSCQYKNDKWIVGYDPLIFSYMFDSIINELQFPIYNIDNPVYDHAHSNISDSSSILLSSDGFNVYDSIGEFIENGKNILPQKLINYIGKGSGIYDQTLILPKKSNQYYVFAWGVSDPLFDSIQNGFTNWRWDILTYCIVDMNENNGKGKVISKMNYLLEYADLSASQMSAVRHANGRDWWLVKPHNKKHLFYTFLVTPESIIPQPIQEFAGPNFLNGVDGQSSFSMDGSMYAITAEANNNVTQINYFDRCSGKMSKYKTIPWVFDSTYNQYMPVGSICFSPNNQFVYLINNVSIIQYNLNNDERIEICNDCRLFPHANILAKNAPDGKIYIGNLNPIGNKLSYIEFPDKNGVDAHYCRLCYLTKNNNTSSFSNMPNYELGALVGSPCDTIKPYVEPPPSTSAQIIVPSAISPNGDGKNDAWHILNVPQLQIAGITLQAVGVYNRWGNEVFKSNDINFSWDAKGWSNDTYYYYISYRTKAGTSQVMKGSVSVVR